MIYLYVLMAVWTVISGLLVIYTKSIDNRVNKGDVQRGLPYGIPGTSQRQVKIKLEAVIGTKEVVRASWWMTLTFCTVEIAIIILLANVHVSDHTHQWAPFVDILALFIIGLGSVEFFLFLITLYFFIDVNFLSQWINMNNNVSEGFYNNNSNIFQVDLSKTNIRTEQIITETYKNINIDKYKTCCTCACNYDKNITNHTCTARKVLEWKPLCDISCLNINKHDSTQEFISHLAIMILLASSKNSDNVASKNAFSNAALDIKLYSQRRYKYNYEYIYELSKNIVGCYDVTTAIVKRLEDYIRIIRGLDSNILYLSFFWGGALIVLTLLLFAKTTENTSSTYDTLIGIIVTIMVTILISTSITIYQMVSASIKGNRLLCAIEALNKSFYGWEKTSKEFNSWKMARIFNFFIKGDLGPPEYDIGWEKGINCEYRWNNTDQQTNDNLVINLSYLFIDQP